MKFHRFSVRKGFSFLLPFLLFLFFACSSEEDSNAENVVLFYLFSSESSGSHLDANVPPVTEGNWKRPAVSDTWQWQLTGSLETGYGVHYYDIDLFDNDAQTIADLQAAGRGVVCYFSAGSSENWREDFSSFQESDMGENLDGWVGERWLDIRSENVYGIMLARLDLAVEKGCDGVELDNMDGYTNESGFSLTARDQLAYNRNLANEAHERNLFIALKNDGDQVDDLLEYFDLVVNEQCHQYNECDLYYPFIEAEKPVWNAEYDDAYVSDSTELCQTANAENIRTLILPLDLDDAFRISCD